MKVIYTEAPYEITLESDPTEEMFDLLEATNWGTGKTVYQHFNSKAHFLHIASPKIFAVREAGALRAFTVFVHRQLPMVNNGSDAYYIRFFCATPEIKGAGIVKNLAKIVIEYVRGQEEKACFYGTIEARNPAVRKVVDKIGMEPLATVKTVGFSRFFPKPLLRVRTLGNGDWEKFLPVLEAQKSHYAFWTTDNVQMPPGYFVYEQKGEVLLGVQVHLAHWAIHSLPGAAGALLPWMPYLPLLNRIVLPKSFRFLSPEGFYIREGAENLLPQFLESLLHHFRRNAAMFWLDSRDPVYKALAGAKLGLLNQFVKGSNAAFVANFKGYQAEETDKIKTMPFYISTYDSI
ncbi:MAG: hypothetical protein ACOYOO_10540 [Saprospiraceae bacterium]|jgi:RimJ/RimL family protein N-acetyltransferase